MTDAERRQEAERLLRDLWDGHQVDHISPECLMCLSRIEAFALRMQRGGGERKVLREAAKYFRSGPLTLWEAIAVAQELEKRADQLSPLPAPPSPQTEKIEGHVFVGGYEIDPTNPAICQICEMPHDK